jgi:hypothetical protein
MNRFKLLHFTNPQPLYNIVTPQQAFAFFYEQKQQSRGSFVHRISLSRAIVPSTFFNRTCPALAQNLKQEG